MPTAHTDEGPRFPSVLLEQGYTVPKSSGVRLLSYSLSLLASPGPGHFSSFHFLAARRETAAPLRQSHQGCIAFHRLQSGRTNQIWDEISYYQPKINFPSF